REELVTMSYHVEWTCKSLNPSPPYCRGKMAWPELLGKKGKEAKAVIEKENPYVNQAIYAPQDTIVTDEYCCNRVRIYVDCKNTCDYANSVVVQIPKVG
ncbi:hypothetical protein EJB05_45008, partial [Eragrostis curvula]